MREHIDAPMAEAVIRWRTAEQGGRLSGPPTAAVYMATTVFEHLDLHLSILIEQLEEREDGSRTCKLDFLVRELAQPHLSPGVRLPVMEGPRVVAEVELT
ncbi:hypothetical protein LFM09_04935 [Lentzea alba]|uniref:hypothetical protein n=1 Tax=Lentzea alba TaxID=2714351 RepID=UPI0039BF4113